MYKSFKHQCTLCLKEFDSNNSLHKHIRADCGKFAKEEPIKETIVLEKGEDPHRIVKSSSTDNFTPGYGFRGYRYATAHIALKPQRETHQLCLDSGCIMSLIDRQFLKSMLPDLFDNVKKMPTPMIVTGISDRKYDVSEYIRIPLYVPTPSGIAMINRELHIVDNLTALALIGIDILDPERAILDFDKKVLRIGSDESLEAPISIHAKDSKVRRTVYSMAGIIVKPRSRHMVLIRGPKKKGLDLPTDRDFIFEPRALECLSTYAHIVDHDTANVMVRNDTDEDIFLPMNSCLGDIFEHDVAGTFFISDDSIELAAKALHRQKNWLRKGLKKALNTAAIFIAALSPDVLETKHPTGVTIYRAPGSTLYLALSKVIDQHLTVWQDIGNADIPEEWHIEIPLVPNWREIYKPGQAKIYPVGLKDHAIIDKDFDTLQAQRRMEYTKTQTPFAFPCFVIWKDTEISPKGRTVVDIRALNQIVMPDAYPLPSQSEILGMLRDATHISTIDMAAFFYQ